MIPLQVNALQKIHDESLAELKLIHAKMKECDTQISSFVTEQEKCLQKLSDMKLEKKKLENEVFFLTCIGLCFFYGSAISPIPCSFLMFCICLKLLNW